MKPEQLSEELRAGSGSYLSQRRWVAGLSLLASGSMALISLYQLGIIQHLPELPLHKFDSEHVNAGPDAYARLATPDATLGLASYAVTLVLAAMAGARRAEQHPWIPLLLGAKLLFDTAQAARGVAVQVRKYRMFCSWCLLAAGATFASLPFALPEILHAARVLKGDADGGDVGDSTATQ